MMAIAKRIEPSAILPAAEYARVRAERRRTITEFKKTNGKFALVLDSAFNRRITAATEMLMSGPAAGDALMKTKYSIDGTRTRGTQNNCGTGTTPWGTLLTGEENWAGYFKRTAGDATNRATVLGADANVALNRYGRGEGASRYNWETAGSDDKYARWDMTLNPAAAADGSAALVVGSIAAASGAGAGACDTGEDAGRG